MDLLTVIGHELGHLLGLHDLDPTEHAGELMAARLPATGSLPLGGERSGLVTLDVSRSAARHADELFGGGSWWASKTRPTLPLLTAASRDSLNSENRDDLVRSGRDDGGTLLADALEVDLRTIVADRRLLADPTSRERLKHERELDELFADADELLGNFDEKVLSE